LPIAAANGNSVPARACSDLLLRRGVRLLLFLARLLRVVDRLDDAAGEAAGTDVGAALGAGGADRRQPLGALCPGLALLGSSLWVLRLGQPIAVALRRSNADVLARAGIVAVNGNRTLAYLGHRRGRDRRKAARQAGGGNKGDRQPAHDTSFQLRFQRLGPRFVPHMRLESPIATLQPARTAAVSKG